MVLDLLPPQPSPPRSLEPVVVRRIRKAAFQQILASSPIRPRRRTVRGSSAFLQEIVSLVPAYHPPHRRARAARPQRTTPAPAERRPVFPRALFFHVAPPL